jgi:hypothetical protein
VPERICYRGPRVEARYGTGRLIVRLVSGRRNRIRTYHGLCMRGLGIAGCDRVRNFFFLFEKVSACSFSRNEDTTRSTM